MFLDKPWMCTACWPEQQKLMSQSEESARGSKWPLSRLLFLLMVFATAAASHQRDAELKRNNWSGRVPQGYGERRHEGLEIVVQRRRNGKPEIILLVLYLPGSYGIILPSIRLASPRRRYYQHACHDEKCMIVTLYKKWHSKKKKPTNYLAF